MDEEMKVFIHPIACAFHDRRCKQDNCITLLWSDDTRRADVYSHRRQQGANGKDKETETLISWAELQLFASSNAPFSPLTQVMEKLAKWFKELHDYWDMPVMEYMKEQQAKEEG